MKIIVDTKGLEYNDEELDIDDAYSVKAEFVSQEMTTAPEVVMMFIKAMELEGYMTTSIYKALDDAMWDIEENHRISTEYWPKRGSDGHLVEE